MLSISSSLCISHGRTLRAFVFLDSSSLYLHYTTASPSYDIQPHFMVDYLIDSLGFSKQEAISASTKVRHLKSTKNSESVINLLKSYNLTKTQIKSIVISQPNILLRKFDKTLDPKFKMLQEIGISGSDLVSVITKDPNLLARGLHTSLIPSINYLRNILGSNEKVVKVMKLTHWPFYGNFVRNNVLLLQKFEVSYKGVEKVIVRNPRLITQSSMKLEENLTRVEKELGIPRGSSMFVYGISVIGSLNKSILQKKFAVFKSFGWSESDIQTIAKSQPVCLTHSEERLCKGLTFFMKELGCTPSWLASRGTILMYSLEKRVKPRHQVYKVLKEKGVIKDFHAILCLSEIDFHNRILRRYKIYIPDDLYERYTKNLNLQ